MTPTANPFIAICTPGPEFSWMWVDCWSRFLPKVMEHFSVVKCFANSHNIYTVRNHCLQQIKNAVDLEQVEYILWIDSDNLFDYSWLEEFKGIMDARPEVSGIGAWYLVQSGMDGGGEVAAGHIENWQCKQATIKHIQAATDLVEIDFVGMGFFLMRSSVLKDLGDNPFNPLIADGQVLQGDDVSFMLKAKERGHRFFLHPKVCAPHLKLIPLHYEKSSGVRL